MSFFKEKKIMENKLERVSAKKDLPRPSRKEIKRIKMALRNPGGAWNIAFRDSAKRLQVMERNK